MKLTIAFALIGCIAVMAFYAGGSWYREKAVRNELETLEVISDEANRDLTDDDVDASLRDLAQ